MIKNTDELTIVSWIVVVVLLVVDDDVLTVVTVEVVEALPAPTRVFGVVPALAFMAENELLIANPIDSTKAARIRPIPIPNGMSFMKLPKPAHFVWLRECLTCALPS